MLVRQIALLAALVASSEAFVAQPSTAFRSSPLNMILKDYDASLEADLAREIDYKPGQAKTEFAKRYGHLAGKKIKTAGEAFADFTKELGYSVNPLYKNMVTDIVGTVHLIVVNARFERDPIWCAGLLGALELLFKNYPDPKVGTAIEKALFKSVGLDEEEVRADAKMVLDWAASASKEDVEEALRGEGSSPIAAVAKKAKEDDFWMYSRYFGLGLVKIMDSIGIEMDKDEVYPVMENWLGTQMGKSHLTACADSDLFFRVKDKLDMMETMMKEIEIREKKRMAERLEEKAEAALRAAERDEKYESEVEAEKEEKAEEKETTVEA